MAQQEASIDTPPVNTIVPLGELSFADQCYYQALNIDITASPSQMGQFSPSQVNPPVSPLEDSSDNEADMEMEISMIQAKTQNIIELMKKMLAKNTLYKKSLKQLSRFVSDQIVSTVVHVNAVRDKFKIIFNHIKERIELDEKNVVQIMEEQKNLQLEVLSKQLEDADTEAKRLKDSITSKEGTMSGIKKILASTKCFLEQLKHCVSDTEGMIEKAVVRERDELQTIEESKAALQEQIQLAATLEEQISSLQTTEVDVVAMLENFQ